MANRKTGTAPRTGAVSIPSTREAKTRLDRTIERFRVPYVTVDFVHDREPPREWVDRLAQISPPTTAHSYLALIWEPGDPWIPVQRWTIQQMLQPWMVDDEVLKELRGPNPRIEGHICTSIPTHAWPVRPPKGYRPCICRHKTEAWRGGLCSEITLSQWKVFQRTGLLARPFWVIQGANGGHRHAFAQQEKLMLEHVGYPTETPIMGAMDYAPFDERVASQIPRFNRLWKLGVTLERFAQLMSRDGIQSFKAAEDKEMRKQMIHEVEDEMREVADIFTSAAAIKELEDHAPRTEIDYERLDDLNNQHFVETGKILSQTKVL